MLKKKTKLTKLPTHLNRIVAKKQIAFLSNMTELNKPVHFHCKKIYFKFRCRNV